MATWQNKFVHILFMDTKKKMVMRNRFPRNNNTRKCMKCAELRAELIYIVANGAFDPGGNFRE